MAVPIHGHFLGPLCAAALLFGVAAVDAVSRSASAAAAPAICPVSFPQSIDRHYSVSGRIRPLLFWTGRRDVGRARITWKQAPDAARRIELLIGTDPERAPRKLNRWGYISETTCAAGADVLGLMTEADEKTIEEATATVSDGKPGGRPYRAIRGTTTRGEANTERIRMNLADTFTYREFDALLKKLPPPGATRKTQVPADAVPGFLIATADMVHASVAAFQKTGKPASWLKRPYVYGGRVYDLTLRTSRLAPPLTAGGRTHSRALESDFETRNRTTGETTRFQITYGTSDDVVDVPLRVVFRPRWWLELDLVLIKN